MAVVSQLMNLKGKIIRKMWILRWPLNLHTFPRAFKLIANKIYFRYSWRNDIWMSRNHKDQTKRFKKMKLITSCTLGLLLAVGAANLFAMNCPSASSTGKPDANIIAYTTQPDTWQAFYWDNYKRSVTAKLVRFENDNICSYGINYKIASLDEKDHQKDVVWNLQRMANMHMGPFAHADNISVHCDHQYPLNHYGCDISFETKS